MKNYSTKKVCEFSRIILGCAALGEYDHGVVDRESLKTTVHCALDKGINTFDVADCYGNEFGLAEENLFRILGDKRKSVNIITKFGVRWNKVQGERRPKTFKDISPEWASIAIENSLRRLKLECIPIYFVHWPDGKTPIEETVYFLSRLRDEGKILHIGLSNFSADDILQASKVAPISFVQYSYSLIDRKIENDILRTCHNLGIEVLCYGALAQGFLSGKYNCREAFDLSDHRSKLPHFSGNNEKKNQAVIDELNRLSLKYNFTPAQMAIAWTLKSRYVDGVVLGAKTESQVNENVDALNVFLENEDYIKLNAISK